MIFQENLGSFFFHALEHSPKFRDYLYGPDAFFRVDGFCEEVSQYVAFQPPAGKLRDAIPFAGIRVPHVILAQSIPALRNQITHQWILRKAEEDPSDERREWEAPLALVVTAVFILIAGDEQLIGERKFAHLWKPIFAAHSMLTPDLRALMDACDDGDAELRPIKVVLGFLTSRVLPTLLIGILLADKNRTDVKIGEYILSIGEIIKLNSCFQPGILKGDSLAIQIRTQLITLAGV
jgi:hypothetical protein